MEDNVFHMSEADKRGKVFKADGVDEESNIGIEGYAPPRSNGVFLSLHKAELNISWGQRSNLVIQYLYISLLLTSTGMCKWELLRHRGND